MALKASCLNIMLIKFLSVNQINVTNSKADCIMTLIINLANFAPLNNINLT
jgi:hypothetical protein